MRVWKWVWLAGILAGVATCAAVARDERVRRQLDAILHHHALAVWVALDLLACEWRSEKIGRQLDALDGLGAPAVQLDALYAELAQPTADDRAVIRASAG